MSQLASKEQNQPIVIDNGSGIIKAGFAGADRPRVVFRSCIGRTKHTRVMPGGQLEGSEVFIGSRAEEHRGALSLSYPMEGGIIRNWADMERLWVHIYSKENLNIAGEDHPVLLTEPPWNPTASREQIAEYFFEGINTPALYFAMQAILSLYASGRTTGIVLDSGDGVTHTVPVYEGFALTHSMVRTDIGGRDVTRFLQLALRRAGYIFNSSSEFEVVRQIKEACCSVSALPAIDGLSSSNPSVQRTPYQLPDGNTILLSSAEIGTPEILFKPSIIGSESSGVHDQIVSSIMKSDMDLRRSLYSQIVLSGGNTLFQGFGERLLHEIRRHSLAPKDAKIRIAAPPERLYAAWMGGSILASLSTFKSMWIPKQDYLEHGARVLRKIT